MLLGNALTLGHELDLFEPEDAAADTEAPNGPCLPVSAAISSSNFLVLRRNRLKRLLFIYISQLASRLGCAFPKTPFHQVITACMCRPANAMLDDKWHDHIDLWIDLSRLVRSSSEFLFPSKSVTKELVRSGRYSEYLNHFRPLLRKWREQYSETSSMTPFSEFSSQ